jgi:hypothetical protein
MNTFYSEFKMCLFHSNSIFVVTKWDKEFLNQRNNKKSWQIKLEDYKMIGFAGSEKMFRFLCEILNGFDL